MAIVSSLIISYIKYMTDDKRKEAERAQDAKTADKAEKNKTKPEEIGGPQGPEPTRYGDWEVGGRCTDF
jgi:hypothetical protein